MAVDPKTGMVTDVSLGIPDWLKTKSSVAGTGAKISTPVADAIAKANTTFKGPEVYKPLIDPVTGNSNMDVTKFSPGKPMAITDVASTAANATANITPPAATRLPVHYQKGNLGIMPNVAPAAVPTKTTAPVVQPAASVVRRAPVRKVNTSSQPTEISQPDEEGLRVATPQGGVITDAPVNAGYGEYSDGTGRINLLYNQDEAAQLHKEALAKQNVQPITALAQPAQQTSTVGYGNGIETYGGDGNLISSTRKLDSNASMGDLLMEKFNTNQQGKKALIASSNASITSQANKDALAVQEQPLKLAEIAGRTAHTKMLTDKGIVMTPAELSAMYSGIAKTNADTNKTLTLLPGEKRIQDSQISLNAAHEKYYGKTADNILSKEEQAAASREAKMAEIKQQQQKVVADAYTKTYDSTFMETKDHAAAMEAGGRAASSTQSILDGQQFVPGTPKKEKTGILGFGAPEVQAVPGKFSTIKAPPGMTYVGTSGGKDVYQDASGKRFMGK